MSNEVTNNGDEKSRLRNRIEKLERGYKEIVLTIENYMNERDYGLYDSDKEIIERVHEISTNKLNGEI